MIWLAYGAYVLFLAGYGSFLLWLEYRWDLR